MDSRQPQTTVRTYNPNVRVANWNEELCLEEDILKDFLAKQDAGTLLIQRSQTLMQTLLAKTELDSSNDKVTFGSKVMLVNPGREGLKPDESDKQMENLPKKLLSGRNCSSVGLNIDNWPTGGLETLVKNSIGLSGCSNTETSCVRNTFEIVKIDHANSDNTLRYGDKFALKSVLYDDLYIFADRIRLGGTSQSKSGIAPIEIVPYENSQPSFGALWMIESFDPLLRMEHEGLPVDKSSPVTIKHCATGQKLAAIEKSTIRTPFGREIALGIQTYFNSHKAEMDNNYWIFK